MRILYVEDEDIKRTTLVRFLKRHEHEATGVETAEEAWAFLTENPCDVVLSDIRLPGMDGTELLSRLREHHPDITVLMVTAYATIDLAVEVMRKGAYDFIAKPFRNDALLLKLDRIAQFRQRNAENRELRQALRESGSLPGLVWVSAAMQEVVDLIRTVAPGPSSVLILGESGTGKELVARALHDQSGRASERFVGFNCAALPASLVESELFGHEKGAFTGAIERRLGRFERAHQGTLYLDDVDAMPIEVQAKLLRVLEERQVERIGSSSSIDLDVRVIASARPDILDKLADNTFRRDLYYRLNVIPIVLPPLRERREDVRPLLQHFLASQRAQRDCSVRSFSADALQQLTDYGWPGNVRELRNLVERLCWVVRKEVVDFVDLPHEYRQASQRSPDADSSRAIDVTGMTYREYIDVAEQAYFTWAMHESDGNLSRAARLLEIPRSTLRDRLRALRMPLAGSDRS